MRKSLLWILVLPVPAAIALGVLLAWLALPQMIAENVKQDAIAVAQQTANQFKIIRGYYTKNVIKKALNDGNLKPSFNHKKEDQGIPLPATFIHDISGMLKDESTSLALTSPFPFPNRAERRQDRFQREAWDYLTSNPSGTYSETSTIDGVPTIRVAVADTMIADACVTCHNSRADTPKNDWQLGDVRGVLEVSQNITAPLARGEFLSTTIILAILVVGLFLTAICVFFARTVTNPLRRMTAAMQGLADGNQSIQIPGTKRQTEIGQMAKAMQVFKDNAIENQRLSEEQKSLVEENQARMRRALNEVADNFEKTVGGVVETVSTRSHDLQSSANGMSVMAEEVNANCTVVGEAGKQAARNVQTVAAASEELSHSIQEISSQVATSAKIAQDAVAQAHSTNADMENLADNAHKIGEVLGLISEIAEQTNLLALNATIEAARAGDAGKGFAVVASEVKSLANQTAKATDDISSQIESIQGATSTAVSSIKGISDTIAEINSIAAGIASAVEEQGAATQEISRNVTLAAADTEKVHTTIGGISDTADKSSHASQEILAATNVLSEQSEILSSEVEGFLKQVRAG